MIRAAENAVAGLNRGIVGPHRRRRECRAQQSQGLCVELNKLAIPPPPYCVSPLSLAATGYS